MNIIEWCGEATSAFLAIFGVVVGWGLSQFSAKKLAHDHARREAGRRCRKVFSRAQEIMHSVLKKAEPRELEAEIPMQHRAVIEFSYYLSDSEKIRMYEAWNNYSQWDQYWPGPPTIFINRYFDGNPDGSSDLPPLELFDEKINSVLCFTMDKRDKKISDRLRHFCKKFSKSA